MELIESDRSSDLFSYFLKCHSKFEEKYKIENHDNKSIVLFFGITGAGKSTLLANIISKLETKEFIKKLESREERFVEIGGIVIGHEAPSTTVIPQPYLFQENIFYDMPGFKDNDDKRKIIINILHKCLLNRLPDHKYIIVININDIFDKKATKLIGDYHKNLRDLFDENYPNYIKNVGFVLTHNDINDYTKKMLKIE